MSMWGSLYKGILQIIENWQLPAQRKLLLLHSYSKFPIKMIPEFWMILEFAMVTVLFTVLRLARNPRLYYLNMRGIQLILNTF